MEVDGRNREEEGKENKKGEELEMEEDGWRLMEVLGKRMGKERSGKSC